MDERLGCGIQPTEDLLEGSTPWNEDEVQTREECRARFNAFAEKYAQACEERGDTRTLPMRRGGRWGIVEAVRMQIDPLITSGR